MDGCRSSYQRTPTLDPATTEWGRLRAENGHPEPYHVPYIQIDNEPMNHGLSPDQYAAAKKKLDEAGVDYLGPDRGVEESMYFRDPNGVGLELYREELGVFDGRPLLD